MVKIFPQGTAAIAFSDVTMDRIGRGNALGCHPFKFVRKRPENPATLNIEVNGVMPHPQLLVTAILVFVVRFHYNLLSNPGAAVKLEGVAMGIGKPRAGGLAC